MAVTDGDKQPEEGASTPSSSQTSASTLTTAGAANAVSKTTKSDASMSAAFLARAKEALSKISGGKDNTKGSSFFEKHAPRLIANFDRTASGEGELSLGAKLGEGAFCEVDEISSIELKRSPEKEAELAAAEEPNSGSSASRRTLGSGTIPGDDIDEADFPSGEMYQTVAQLRGYMSKNFLRGDELPRYALKRLKSHQEAKYLEQGLIDIAIEAKFLACLNHPNVIKMRGTVGEDLTPSFGLVLDRLYMTLEDKMDFWKEEKEHYTVTCFCFGGSGNKDVDKQNMESVLFQQLTVAYDLACALRYIHSKNLVYRDIKPENAGFDVRGNIKIFDFGFCKELKKDIKDKKSGQYKLTRMTGSPPYMAPENFRGDPYGKAVDVFSFGVLLWEMLASKYAFYHLSRADYKQQVVESNFRPSVPRSWPPCIRDIVPESWAPDPKKRPTFQRIATILKVEYQEMTQDKSMMERSSRLVDSSMRSIRGMRSEGR